VAPGGHDGEAAKGGGCADAGLLSDANTSRLPQFMVTVGSSLSEFSGSSSFTSGGVRSALWSLLDWAAKI
jgi:hypothetical protein